MHTIHETARAAKPRRKGQPAFNAADDLLVKRHTGPTELPHGTTVIEATGGRLVRTPAGWHEQYPDGTEGGLVSTLDLAYPVVEVKAPGRGYVQSRAERRATERQARKESARLARFKRDRVDAFLAATAQADREKYARALGADVTVHPADVERTVEALGGTA